MTVITGSVPVSVCSELQLGCTCKVVSSKLLEEGIYVIGFFFPVVPRGEARIRVQMSAAHDREHLDRAIEAFTKVGKELGVI